MLFNVFSNPFEGDFLSLAKVLACRLFLKDVARVNEFSAEFERAPIPIEGRMVQAERLSVGCWRPEIGFVKVGLVSGVKSDGHARWLEAQALIAAFLAGAISKLSIDVDLPRPLIFAGRTLSGERYFITAESDCLTVETTSGESLTVTRQDSSGISPVWARTGKDDVLRFGTASACTIGTADWLSSLNLSPENSQFFGDLTEFCKLIERAASILEASLPLYYLWCATLIREIVPLIAPQGGTTSGSFIYCPGHIHFSVGASLIQMIANLIHECSHQFLHMLVLNAPTIKKDAPEAYSILKNTNRPLDKVLLGYHAFGNVLLALRLLGDANGLLSVAALQEEESHVDEIVSSLDEPLQEYADDYLEEAGKEIYSPLRAQLLETSVLSHVR